MFAPEIVSPKIITNFVLIYLAVLSDTFLWLNYYRRSQRSTLNYRSLTNVTTAGNLN